MPSSTVGHTDFIGVCNFQVSKIALAHSPNFTPDHFSAGDWFPGGPSMPSMSMICYVLPPCKMRHCWSAPGQISMFPVIAFSWWNCITLLTGCFNLIHEGGFIRGLHASFIAARPDQWAFWFWLWSFVASFVNYLLSPLKPRSSPDRKQWFTCIFIYLYIFAAGTFMFSPILSYVIFPNLDNFTRMVPESLDKKLLRG